MPKVRRRMCWMKPLWTDPRSLAVWLRYEEMAADVLGLNKDSWSLFCLFHCWNASVHQVEPPHILYLYLMGWPWESRHVFKLPQGLWIHSTYRRASSWMGRWCFQWFFTTGWFNHQLDGFSRILHVFISEDQNFESPGQRLFFQNFTMEHPSRCWRFITHLCSFQNWLHVKISFTLILCSRN